MTAACKSATDEDEMPASDRTALGRKPLRPRVLQYDHGYGQYSREALERSIC